MENIDIVKKLIGNISPIGETNTDNERFDNLKAMCELANDLITEIDNVSYYKGSGQFSVKRAGEYAKNFLTNTIGITE
jgi:hypothetical protein